MHISASFNLQSAHFVLESMIYNPRTSYLNLPFTSNFERVLMPKFDVEQDLVELLWEQAKARPFEHLTFSDALRRVLVKGKPLKVDAPKPMPKPRPIPGRTRKSNVKLSSLIEKNILTNGQELFLCRGSDIFKEQKATINGDRLTYQGEIYSMSKLASILLEKVGFHAPTVRGTMCWVTENGKSILEIWNEHGYNS